MTVLPAADWLDRADLAAMVAALGPDKARFVGGAVRDTLLGLEVKDIDVATPLPPQEVIARLKRAAIRTVPTGIDHGTVTALLEQGPVEITTLRHDVSTDGRRATVAFAQDWREDAGRRDFTINALYADPATRTVHDWFGGLDDLAARRVRFIGDARQRIREDHLRILRYFRFQARFGSQPADAQAESACAELAATLKGLSRERIGMEMMTLLGLPDPAPTVTRMDELGVLAQVLPEADTAALARLVAAEQASGVPPDPLRRLAALLPPGQAEAVAARFRLSNAQKKRLVTATILPGTGRGTAARSGGVEGHPQDGAAARVPLHQPAAGPPPPPGEEQDARVLAYRLGREQALDRLLLDGRSIAPLDGWDIPVFPLKGGDVVAAGITAGPQVARILRRIEDRWLAEGFPDADRVRAMLAELIAT